MRSPQKPYIPRYANGLANRRFARSRGSPPARSCRNRGACWYQACRSRGIDQTSDEWHCRRVKCRVLVIDNYDSFTYNLVQYLQTLAADCDVHLNDRISAQEVERRAPDGVLLSPGPGTPDDAGVTLEVISRLAGRIPILGVCLGHQAIGQAYGGTVIRAPRLMHGKTSPIEHDGRGIFESLPSPFLATRYHSLVVDSATLPACLEVTARTKEGEIMGIRHRELDVIGVQFHPESFLTEHGMTMIETWLKST